VCDLFGTGSWGRWGRGYERTKELEMISCTLVLLYPHPHASTTEPSVVMRPPAMSTLRLVIEYRRSLVVP
jgi:hypothetical protein